MRASVLFLLSLLAGCHSELTDPTTAAQVAAIPETVTVDGRSVSITVEIWRNMMPMAGTPRRGLMVAVTAPEGSPIVSVEKVWVALDDELWSGAAQVNEGSRTWVARDGPEWPVGSFAAVVARVRIGANTVKLVRVGRVEIRGAV